MTDGADGVATIRGAQVAWTTLGDSAGSGTPFVWGHGLTSSRGTEAEFSLVNFADLATQTPVVRYDARGHGESELTSDLDAYSWDQMALDQIGLCDSLGIDTWVSAGASLGAATAIHAAVVAPERVRALVLVIPPTGWETRAAQTDMYEQMAQIIEKRGMATLARATPPPPPDPFADDDAWAKRRTDGLLAADPVRMATLFRGARTANLPSREEVSAIAVPALILAWTGDSGHPVSSAEELDALLPDSELHLASTLEQFAGWTGLIRDFLSRLGAAQ